MGQNDQVPFLLLIEDDDAIRTALELSLSRQGHRVATAATGEDGLNLLREQRPDLVVLDVMLPGIDGFEVCRRIRRTDQLPIILLTARSDETDRIVGLELGADDYVAKPFNPRELLARIRSALRRAGMNAAPQEAVANRFRFAGWTLDASRRTLVSPAGSLVDLTTGEFDLLVALARHPQQVLSRDQLLDHVHGRSSYNIDRSIDVQISRLRRKIEADPQAPALVKTVRNGGYFFSAEVTDAAA